MILKQLFRVQLAIGTNTFLVCNRCIKKGYFWGLKSTCLAPSYHTSSLSFRNTYKTSKTFQSSIIPLSSKQFHVSSLDFGKSTSSVDFESEGFQNYLNKIEEEYESAKAIMMDPTNSTEIESQRANRTVTMREQLVYLVKEYRTKYLEKLELADIINNEPEMADMAKKDLEQCIEDIDEIKTQIQLYLVPPEMADHNDVIIEVLAGVGGQEAMLFANEIFQMYENYSNYKGWGFSPVQIEDAELGGIRRASSLISGHDVFRTLKFEAGVHRVQRVPKTERAGRVHTSTAIVVVLPQPTEVDIQINIKDLLITTFKSSGAGGQSVNKTESAVRIKHLPSGMAVECQMSRSQIKNKEMAMQILRTRLYEQELDKKMSEHRSNRKLQVGTAARSEKIRTFNFNQDRITDHRVGENMFNIDTFLSGGESLDGMIESLQEESQKERLLELVLQFEEEATRSKMGAGKKR